MIQGTGKFVRYSEKLDREVRNREKLCSALGGKFKGPNILFEIDRYSR